jgi:nitroreductase
MHVHEALARRRSIRAFLPKPVERETIRRVIEKASRAASGGNLQPWHIHIVAGEALDKLKTEMRQRVIDAPGGEGTEYDIYPKEVVAPYRDRRFKCGEDMYGLLEIPRADKAARAKWFGANYQFFGAPMALFCTVDRRMGPPQWSDMGMFLQSLMLMLVEEGLDSCAQECWALYHQTIARHITIPPERMLFTGMSIGYRDPDAVVNQLKTDRAPVDEITEFVGI